MKIVPSLKPANDNFDKGMHSFQPACAAVRLLEEFNPVDVEAAVRAALDKMSAGGEGERSWHVDEMVRRKDEAEAAYEDSEDQGLVVTASIEISHTARRGLCLRAVRPRV
eukprot:1156305-Pelagomonas_calceolata.AAC.10